MADRTDTSEQTKETERVEEQAVHQADRAPTGDEAATADETAERLRRSGEAEDVAAHHKDMDERGAHIRGEGQID